jgi:protein SCO1/2
MIVVVGLSLVILLGALAIIAIALMQPAPTNDTLQRDFNGIEAVTPPRPLENFSLIDQNGESITLDTLKGKPALIAFGFTNCPDVCPLTLNEFKQLKGALGEKGDALNFVFISVDGERDTPAVLKGYFERMGIPSFVGITGDAEAVRAWGAPFNLQFSYGERNPNTGYYAVEHTAHYFLLNADGAWVAKINYGTLREDILNELLRVVGA